MNNFDLRRLQLTELQMLKDVAAFCDENDICYFPDAGTLLGAVRHKGFIPWDDDIDICMDVKNYQKFIKLAPKGLPDRYFVQNYRTDPKVSINWSKVRINGTTSMETDMTALDIHYGICMDVFIKNGLAETKRGKQRQRWAASWMNTLLQKYASRVRGIKQPRYIELIYRFIPDKVRLLLIRILEKMVLTDTTKKKECYLTWFTPDAGVHYPSSFYDSGNRKEIPFEDDHFWATKDMITYLELTYGEWEKFPPEEDRGGHGDIIVDFENPYTKYYTGENRQ